MSPMATPRAFSGWMRAAGEGWGRARDKGGIRAAAAQGWGQGASGKVLVQPCRGCGIVAPRCSCLAMCWLRPALDEALPMELAL